MAMTRSITKNCPDAIRNRNERNLSGVAVSYERGTPVEGTWNPNVQIQVFGWYRKWSRISGQSG